MRYNFTVIHHVELFIQIESHASGEASRCRPFPFGKSLKMLKLETAFLISLAVWSGINTSHSTFICGYFEKRSNPKWKWPGMKQSDQCVCGSLCYVGDMPSQRTWPKWTGEGWMKCRVFCSCCCAASGYQVHSVCPNPPSPCLMPLAAPRRWRKWKVL